MSNNNNNSMESGRLCESDESGKSTADQVISVEPHQGAALRNLATITCNATLYEHLLESRDRCEQCYLALYDNIPLLCLTTDSAGTIVTINAYGAQHLGYSQHELVGRPVLTTVHPEDVGKAEHQLSEALAKRGSVVRNELRNVCKDGSIFWVQGTARAMPGDRERCLMVCEDITERKEMDKQLTQYQNRLKSLTIDMVLAEEDERRRIAQGLHDQVGHALALAKMSACTLRTSEHPPAARRSIADICGFLDEAINHTRALTFKLSSPVLYEVGLEAALQALGEQLEEQTNLRIHVDCDPAPGPMPEEVAVIIYRMVEELLFNVFKHAQAHNVMVRTHRIGGGLQISVDDDGVGLAPSEAGELPGSSGRFGLFSIRARIEQLGGRFDIGTSGMGGAHAALIIPVFWKEQPSRLHIRTISGKG